MLQNYTKEALAADLEVKTLKEKRGVKVLCAETGKWVAGMIKTVDDSGVIVATVGVDGTAAGEFCTWAAVGSCLKAINKQLPANFDVRKWTNADWLTPYAKAPPAPRPAIEKKVKKHFPIVIAAADAFPHR